MVLATDRSAAAPQPGAPGPRGGPAYAAAPLFLAAVIALVAVCWVGLNTGKGQRLDQRAMLSLNHNRGPASGPLVDLLHVVSIGWMVVALAAIVVVALLRSRIRLALAAVILVAGANITTQVLKKVVLDRPDLGRGTGHFMVGNSLPSGHTTVVFSLALAAVLVVPRSVRGPMALVAAAAGALTGLATLISGWHRPSDVAAALLVVIAWAAVVSLIAGTPRGGLSRRGGGFCYAVLGGLLSAGVVLWGPAWTVGDRSAVLVTTVVLAGAAAVGTGLHARLVGRTSD